MTLKERVGREALDHLVSCVARSSHHPIRGSQATSCSLYKVVDTFNVSGMKGLKIAGN